MITGNPYDTNAIDPKKIRQMKKESWIRNVLRIYPEKTKEETEALYNKLFPFLEDDGVKN